MKIQRWYVGQWNYHGAPDNLGKWCASSDVTDLESSHAQLLEALQEAIALYGKFGAIVNDPHAPGEWITKAQQAVRRATE